MRRYHHELKLPSQVEEVSSKQGNHCYYTLENENKCIQALSKHASQVFNIQRFSQMTC